MIQKTLNKLPINKFISSFLSLCLLISLTFSLSACTKTQSSDSEKPVAPTEEEVASNDGEKAKSPSEEANKETTDPNIKKPVIYTSFFPIYTLTKDLLDEHFDVRIFMPADKDPHLWEPTPKDMQRLSQADLLIVNGANLERWLSNVSNALPDLKILNLSEFVELITYKGAANLGDFQYMAKLPSADLEYAFDFGHTHEDILRVAFYNNSKNLGEKQLIAEGKKIMEQKGKVIPQRTTFDVEDGVVYSLEMGHESGRIDFKFPEEGNWILFSDRTSEQLLSYRIIHKNGDPVEDVEALRTTSTTGLDKISYDPHSWMSVVNAKSYLNAIYATITKAYPDLSRTLDKKKVRLISKLSKLEYKYRKVFKDVRIRDFVVTHQAYAYLARDFDLKQFALQGLVSSESPSLKTIRRAINFCKHYKIHTIFYEYGRLPKGADTIALELGGDVKPLASMEYLTPEQSKQGKSYIELISMNLDSLAEAMK